jgi:hypothetical protein
VLHGRLFKCAIGEDIFLFPLYFKYFLCTSCISAALRRQPRNCAERICRGRRGTRFEPGTAGLPSGATLQSGTLQLQSGRLERWRIVAQWQCTRLLTGVSGSNPASAADC